MYHRGPVLFYTTLTTTLVKDPGELWADKFRKNYESVQRLNNAQHILTAEVVSNKENAINAGIVIVRKLREGNHEYSNDIFKEEFKAQWPDFEHLSAASKGFFAQYADISLTHAIEVLDPEAYRKHIQQTKHLAQSS